MSQKGVEAQPHIPCAPQPISPSTGGTSRWNKFVLTLRTSAKSFSELKNYDR